MSRCREQHSWKRDQQVQRPLGEDLEGRVVRGNGTNRKHVPVKGECRELVVKVAPLVEFILSPKA